MTSGGKSKSASVQFRRTERKGLYGYPSWPARPSQWTNTVVGAIIGCELMGHAYYEKDLWITADVASIVTGVCVRNIEMRCWSKLFGHAEAWTWCSVRKPRNELRLYLPDLMVHCQDVIGVHAQHYLNVVRQVFTENLQSRHKVLSRTQSDFRGKWLAAHKLEDIVELSGKVKFKRVFGKAYPYSAMDDMLLRSADYIAHAELTGGYPHI